MQQEAVVIEERRDGTRIVWNFGRREKHELPSSSGQVGGWLRIDGDNTVPTKPTLCTTCVEVPPLSGKHVMLKVPAVRVPCLGEDLESGVPCDQSQCFWSPFLSPIHAFFDAHDIPQGVLLEVDVIKVCDTLNDMLEKKCRPRAEWMISKGMINEANTATEDKPLAWLQTLGVERIEGVVVRRGDNHCTIAAELRDGSQKLFVACDPTIAVGDVVSFVPMEVELNAEVRLAVSCRLSHSGFAKPLGHSASHFVIPSSALTPSGDHYHAMYLGLVDDSKNVLRGAIRMPKYVIARIDTQEGYYFRNTAVSPHYFRVAVNVQLEQWTLQATCARVRGGHGFFACFPKELAKYPSFCASINRIVDLTGIGPVLGQWYEMGVRFYATPESFAGERPSVVISARCIPKPPSAPEFAVHPAIAQEPPKKAKLEPEEQVLTARCTHEKGDDALFECATTRDGECKTFLTTVKCFRECTACSPTLGQWYELVVRFYIRAPPSRAHILAANVLPCSSLTLGLNTDGAPSSGSAKPKAKKLEPEEQVLAAICTHKKGEDAFFECATRHDGERKRFLATLKCFQECNADKGPTPGQWYQLTVRFYVRASPSRAHILAANVFLCSSLCAQNAQASNCAVASKNPLDATRTGWKAKVEPEEWRLKAVCVYVKGEDTFFEPVPKENAKYPVFQTTTKTFVEKIGCAEPKVGQAYTLTLKFYIRSEKADGVPRAHVMTATAVGKQLSALQFRRMTVAESASRHCTQVPVDDSSATTAKEQRLSKYTGVVCYKDGSICYVYSAQLQYEIPVGSPAHGLDAGDWVEFSVNDDKTMAVNPKHAPKQFPTTPLHHSVLVECSIMVPMDVQDTDDIIMSSFVGNVRDTHGLVQWLSPGVHSATIRYVYEEGRDCGLWQLEYVYAKEL